MDRSLLKTILFGLALAMGVAVIVLNIVAPPSPTSATTLLAFGVAALAVAGLQK
jgi:hypothetical protein